MMKKQMLAGALALSLVLGATACGSSKPSLKEVEEAISSGRVTMEDALEKGWITQEWMDNYLAENSVDAADKVAINALEPFSTTAADGSTFTLEELTGTKFLAFLDPASEDCTAYYEALVSGYEGVKNAGADIVVAVKGDLDHEMFADAPFPVISYNTSLETALKKNVEMVVDHSCIGVWIVNGSAFSAWYTTVSAEGLVDDAAAYVKMAETFSAEGSADGDAAAIMG